MLWVALYHFFLIVEMLMARNTQAKPILSVSSILLAYVCPVVHAIFVCATKLTLLGRAKVVFYPYVFGCVRGFVALPVCILFARRGKSRKSSANTNRWAFTKCKLFKVRAVLAFWAAGGGAELSPLPPCLRHKANTPELSVAVLTGSVIFHIPKYITDTQRPSSTKQD